MPEVTLKKQDGAEAGRFSLEASVFEAEINPVLVREVYNAYMTNQRQGTHSTKTRGFVSGGGKKPWKQKGTGRARQGSIRATQWRGGAIAFGPLPRDYREKVNRKKRQGAFRSVISAMHASGSIIFVDDIALSAPKTKEVIALREKLGARGKTLIVTVGANESLARAAANLGSNKTTPTRVSHVDAISIYDLLVCDTLIITREAGQALQERLK